MKSINKWQYDFLIEVFMLFISIKGRLNFLQLSRYGTHGEQHYRNQFSKPFDFLTFNRTLIDTYAGKDLVIAIDPSYIPKSGKATNGLGYFWSGTASRSKWGLEVSGIAAIDIDNHTAFHLEAVQTPSDLSSTTLLEHYTHVLVARKQALLAISKYMVADAYFSKYGFVSKLQEEGFDIISRLRDDADLKYRCLTIPKKGRGRPRKYDGKVDFKNLKLDYFKCIEQTHECKTYQANVYSKALKSDINLVIVYTNKNGQWLHKLYFATDLKLAAKTILKYYKSRFLIEFTFRDAKQHTGMNHCQARSESKLHFHWNASLTSINLAKVTHWLNIPQQERGTFSMEQIKTLHHNELLLKRFLDVFGIKANLTKNIHKLEQLRYYGIRAA